MYSFKVKGNITCSHGVGASVFLMISDKKFASSAKDSILYKSVNYNKKFTIQGHKEFNKKPELHLQIRHICIQPSSDNCLIKIFDFVIPPENICKSGEKIKNWNFRNLDLAKPNITFEEKCV
uniref:Secreted protein n=1 Tax=Strongyloides papillosus TaxID=174720 RepID=A0A0N5B980_STREA